jgi:hypothetical protein
VAADARVQGIDCQAIHANFRPTGVVHAVLDESFVSTYTYSLWSSNDSTSFLLNKRQVN